MIMILHDECPGGDLLRGSLEQVLPQPRINPAGPMTVSAARLSLPSPTEPSVT